MTTGSSTIHASDSTLPETQKEEELGKANFCVVTMAEQLECSPIGQIASDKWMDIHSQSTRVAQACALLQGIPFSWIPVRTLT